ncbi:MAG: glycosyltransferase [Planctomycetota bacterium]|jgi:glycosyltransferase involved in cell wall biosynthesis
MATESESAVYKRGVELAEAGQHEQALECMNQHLKANPKDGDAHNDAGAILYCLGKVEEAIRHFEKARALCGESAEICWNLAEAYLDGGYPVFAAQLFDGMEKMGILSVDLINRTANVFLDQGYYGNATETLLRSLEMSGDQEILKPMIEVVRSKRPKVVFFEKSGSRSAESVFDFVKQRFVAELHNIESFEQIMPKLQWFDIAWFEGCSDTVVEASWNPKNCEMVVRLSADDVYDPLVKDVKWESVSSLIAPVNSYAYEALIDQVEDIEKRTHVVRIDRGVDLENIKFDSKQRGKRVACISDLSAKSNPMFLLQCMQKLHYLDQDYRLYIGGEFEDKSLEQYIKHMVEVLGLSSVVFFDGEVKNVSKWLRDKHYIVATGIGQGGLSGALEGMACGLKPVVHNFPGAEDVLPGKFLFNMAEDFCSQILSDEYEPAEYREIVGRSYSRKACMKETNEVFVRIEKDMAEQERLLQKQQPRSSSLESAGEGVNQWQEPAKSKVDPGLMSSVGGFGVSTDPPSQLSDGSSAGQAPEPVSGQVPISNTQLPAAAIPIEPIKSNMLDVRIETPASANQENTGLAGQPFDGGGSLNQRPPVSSPQSVPGGISSINKVAAEAVQVSRALAEAANQIDPVPVQSDWNSSGTAGGDLSQMGYGSLEACVKDNKLGQVASEFSDNTARAENQLKRAKVNQIPFVS